jgi:hypothetical protein
MLAICDGNKLSFASTKQDIAVDETDEAEIL